MYKDNIITLLDLGSSKLAGCVIRFKNGKAELLAHTSILSKGIKSGIIVDLELLSNSIVNLITQLEELIQYNIKHIIININGGENILIQNIAGNIKLSEKIINNKVMEKLYNKILTAIDNNKYEILHYATIEHIIDGLKKVDNPVGMIAETIATRLNVILLPASIISNAENCLVKCQLDINDIVADIYSTTLGVVSKAERQKGAILIDFGFESSRLIFYKNNRIMFLKYIPIGSNHITNDISYIFKLSHDISEIIKIKYANLDPEELRQERLIDLNDIGIDSLIQENLLFNVVSARVDELIDNIADILFNIKGQLYPILITGGGANLNSLTKYMSHKMKNTINLGETRINQIVENNENLYDLFNPQYASLIGMIHYVTEQKKLFSSPRSFLDCSTWNRLISLLIAKFTNLFSMK
jgi:cell division protein FtsA